VRLRIEAWLAQRGAAGWVLQGGIDRLALCERWREVAERYGADSGPGRGALLDLVRDAWGDPYIVTVVGAGWSWAERPRCRKVAAKPFYSTELEALIAALEAAP
jgi:hypothetical protein